MSWETKTIRNNWKMKRLEKQKTCGIIENFNDGKHWSEFLPKQKVVNNLPST